MMHDGWAAHIDNKKRPEFSGDPPGTPAFFCCRCLGRCHRPETTAGQGREAHTHPTLRIVRGRHIYQVHRSPYRLPFRKHLGISRPSSSYTSSLTCPLLILFANEIGVQQVITREEKTHGCGPHPQTTALFTLPIIRHPSRQSCYIRQQGISVSAMKGFDSAVVSPLSVEDEGLRSK